MHIGLEEVKQLVSEPEDQELDPPPSPFCVAADPNTGRSDM